MFILTMRIREKNLIRKVAILLLLAECENFFGPLRNTPVLSKKSRCSVRNRASANLTRGKNVFLGLGV